MSLPFPSPDTAVDDSVDSSVTVLLALLRLRANPQTLLRVRDRLADEISARQSALGIVEEYLRHHPHSHSHSKGS